MGESSAVAAFDDDRHLTDLKSPTVLLQEVVQGRDHDTILSGLIANLALPNYSITDLMGDVAEVKASVAKNQVTTDRLINDWTALDRILGQCLAATTLTNERFLENTSHAFCHYDQAGIILGANNRMLGLNPDCIGKNLASYFVEMQSDVRRAIADGSPQPLDLQMQTQRGLLPVLAEFGKTLSGNGATGYALILDMSDRVHAEWKAFEAAPYGMLKLDTQHRIVYANEKARALLESDFDELIGVDARRVLTDIDNQERRLKVVREGLERREGRGGEYNLVLTRSKSRKQTHLRVSSIPLFDAAGKFAGSIECLQPMDRAVAQEALATLVATESDYQALFEKVLAVLKPFVDFDWAFLFVCSPDGGYSRVVCSHGPEIKFESRWFATIPGYENWLKQDNTFVPDLQTFDPKAVSTPDMQHAIAEGMRGLLCIPVRQGNNLLGGLSLTSKKASIFNLESRRIAEGLMLEQALLPTFHLIDREERDFVTNLMKEIAGIEDLQALAKSVVESLARFYQFQNVSIFKVNVLRQRFQLLAQANGRTDAIPAMEGYRQRIDKGLLGECLRRRDYVILSDLQDPDSEMARLYVKPSPEAGAGDLRTRSELCMPIRLFKRVLWILNLEDDRKDAFTVLEVEALRRVIDQIQSILERTFQSTVLAQVLDVCPAAIVITNQENKILRCNKEAQQMLQIDPAASEEYLSRRVHASLDDLSTEPTTTKVNGASRGEIPVQICRFTLEEEYDHVVFLIQDVSDLRWSMNFEKVKAALAETTAQVRVPVSLLSSYLRRLGHQVTDEPLRDLTKKALRQIDRIELTYDRVIAAYGKDTLPASRASSFEVGLLFRHILSDLPVLDRTSIAAPQTTNFYIKTDPYRMLFAVSSMLFYLLRARTNADPIAIAVSQAGKMVQIEMTGTVQRNAGVGDLAALVNKTRAEIALGQKALVQIAKDAGGEFKRRRTKDGECLRLRIPAVAPTR
jgi:PAS domain-containing protein